MTAEPHWTAVVSALAVATVAIIGAYIAWGLWKTNQDMLRERLYDRRFAIFEATHTLIIAINDENGLTWDASRKFSDMAQRARFMFSHEDSQYFELLRSKAMELAKLTAETEGKLPSQAQDKREDRRLLCEWFNIQVEEVYLRMNKYLLFEK